MAPYEGEYASHFSINKILQSEQVKKLLKRTSVRERGLNDTSFGTLLNVHRDDLVSRNGNPRYIFAIDGSSQEVKVENGYPGATIGYLTIAGVLIDRKLISDLDDNRPANPVEMRKTQNAVTNAFALPGVNTVLSDMPTVADSFRQSVFEIFSTTYPTHDTESLLDTYEALLLHRENFTRARCPYEDCIGNMTGSPYLRGCTKCNCSLNRDLYSTDALRVHERITGATSNLQALGELRQVLEHLHLINFIRVLENKKMLRVLNDMATVMDGPLAIFSSPAWLSQAIHVELTRINELMIERDSRSTGILMLGIEKSGQFMEHFEHLDTTDSLLRSGLPEMKTKVGGSRLANGLALLPDDQYIKSNIIHSTSEKPYGLNTYFGRKFLYKTRSGAKIVAMTPFLSDSKRDITKVSSDGYSRLSDALKLLDDTVSLRFPNAVTPLVSAHSEAAIPLRMGNRILEKLARESVGKAR